MAFPRIVYVSLWLLWLVRVSAGPGGKPKADTEEAHFRRVCYRFIYDAVGSVQKANFKSVSSNVKLLCRDNPTRCAAWADDLWSAVDMKLQPQVPHSKTSSISYGSWCEKVLNDEGRDFSRAMAMFKHRAFSVRGESAPESPPAPAAAAATAKKAPQAKLRGHQEEKLKKTNAVVHTANTLTLHGTASPPVNTASKSATPAHNMSVGLRLPSTPRGAPAKAPLNHQAPKHNPSPASKNGAPVKATKPTQHKAAATSQAPAHVKVATGPVVVATPKAVAHEHHEARPVKAAPAPVAPTRPVKVAAAPVDVVRPPHQAATASAPHPVAAPPANATQLVAPVQALAPAATSLWASSGTDMQGIVVADQAAREMANVDLTPVGNGDIDHLFSSLDSALGAANDLEVKR